LIRLEARHEWGMATVSDLRTEQKSAVNDGPLRWGIVGLGGFVRWQIAPAIQRCNRAVISACSTRRFDDARQFAEEFGVPQAYSSVDELVADPSVDAVFVATPNGEHHHAVVAAARAGKHVLCEKPLALALHEAEDMVQACRQAGVVLRMGLQFRLEEVLGYIRDVIASGSIGMPLMLHIERTSALDQPGAWRRVRAKGGSILYDTGVHLLDLIGWLLQDRLKTLYGVGHQGTPCSSSEDSLTMLGMTQLGCQTVIRISREAPFGNNDLTVMGTKGLIRTGPLRLVKEHTVTVTTDAGETHRTFPATDLYSREIDVFVSEVRDGSTLLPSGEDGVRLVKTTLAALRSLDEGQAVSALD
jgi:1,5-anhydro-D-fructose reductase (1,5-anhydro-D-mannitol-forming)